MRCLEIDVEIELDDGGAARLRAASVATEESENLDGFFGDGNPFDAPDDELGFGDGGGEYGHGGSFGGSFDLDEHQHRRLPQPPPPLPSASDDEQTNPKSGLSQLLQPALAPPAAPRVDEMAHKLDVIMLELFRYMDEVLGPRPKRAAAADEGNREGAVEDGSSRSSSSGGGGGGSCGSGGMAVAQQRLWRALHGVFEQHVIVTHIKFVQFLLLRFVALRPAPFAGQLVASLQSAAADQMQPHLRRINTLSTLRPSSSAPRRCTSRAKGPRWLRTPCGLLSWVESRLPGRAPAARAQRARVPGGDAAPVVVVVVIVVVVIRGRPRGSDGAPAPERAGEPPPRRVLRRHTGHLLRPVLPRRPHCRERLAEDQQSGRNRGSGTSEPPAAPFAPSSPPPPPSSASSSSSSSSERVGASADTSSSSSSAASLRAVLDPARFQRLCESPLRPLAMCLERVRGEFLAVASSRELGLLSTDAALALATASDDTLPCARHGLGSCSSSGSGNRNSSCSIGSGGGGGGAAERGNAPTTPVATPVPISPGASRVK